MDFPVPLQVAISFACGLLGTGLQMTKSKLIGVVLIVFSLGWLWWLFVPIITTKLEFTQSPLPIPLWTGWTAIILFGGIYGWWIYEPEQSQPLTIPISPQISSKNQSGGINANYGNIGSVIINPPLPENPQKIEPPKNIPSLSVDTQNAMVVRLGGVLSSFGGHLRVTVEPRANASYSFAHTLAGIFREARWETVFRDPLKSGRGFQPNAMNRGIAVQGNNNELVKTVAGVLEGVGCTNVATVAHEIQKWAPGTPLPQLDLDQHAISIEVSCR